jgi:hypothetical protein
MSINVKDTKHPFFMMINLFYKICQTHQVFIFKVRGGGQFCLITMLKGCSMAQRVKHCAEECSVAHKGAAWLTKLQLGSDMVSLSWMVVHWLTVRQARVQISAWHPMEVLPTEPTAVKI